MAGPVATPTSSPPSRAGSELKFEDSDTVDFSSMASGRTGGARCVRSRNGPTDEILANGLAGSDAVLGVAFINETSGQVLAYSTLEELGLANDPKKPPSADAVGTAVANTVGSFTFDDGTTETGGSLADFVSERVEISESYTSGEAAVFNVGDASDYFHLDSGASRVTTNGGEDAFDILDGIHAIDTGADADTIYVKGGTNQIKAGAGADEIFLKGGSNLIDLGSGSDTLVIDTSTTDAVINIA